MIVSQYAGAKRGRDPIQNDDMRLRSPPCSKNVSTSGYGDEVESANHEGSPRSSVSTASHNSSHFRGRGIGIKAQVGEISSRARRLGEQSLRSLGLARDTVHPSPRVLCPAVSTGFGRIEDALVNHDGLAASTPVITAQEGSSSDKMKDVVHAVPVIKPAVISAAAIPSTVVAPGLRAAARQHLQAIAAAASSGLLEPSKLRTLFETVRQVFVTGEGAGRHALPLISVIEAVRRASPIKSHASDG